MTERSHILTVDAARGAMAFTVMAYHILEREGIAEVERAAYYAVYSFFAISGFSLHIAYREKLDSSAGVRSYLIKRYFRIAPLFYVALLLRLFLVPMPADPIAGILLNLSLGFGFANPGAASLINGGWSIGIEFVYYLAFPAMVVVGANRIERYFFIAIAGIILMVFFDNSVLRENQTMNALVWTQYTQPIAFFGYFATGAAVAEMLIKFPDLKGSRYAIPIVIGALVPFLVVRVDNPLQLLTGVRGFILMTATLMFVCAVAFAKEPAGRYKEAAIWLGILSYPVYLLHPAVHQFLLLIGIGNSAFRSIAVVALTVGLSVVTSRYIEGPARAFGRHVAK
jgi:peptidoglycan/LPS O-acetylase OafA/YrhL